MQAGGNRQELHELIRVYSHQAAAQVKQHGKENDLLERLKEWRRNEASTQGVPAYVILHNSSLTEIARARPTDVDSLAMIGGIGAMKLERYGAAVIGLVAEDRADNASRNGVQDSQTEQAEQ